MAMHGQFDLMVALVTQWEKTSRSRQALVLSANDQRGACETLMAQLVRWLHSQSFFVEFLHPGVVRVWRKQ